jgi:hypothetical protein
VPGAKPVVPIRASSPGHPTVDSKRVSRSFHRPPPSGNTAQAAAVVAISDPEPPEPEVSEPHRTTVRERQQSEPAPVVPLQRRKDESTTQTELDAEEPLPLETVRQEVQKQPTPDRDTSLPNIPVRAGPPILASDLLREQMRPSSPGEKELRIGTVALCLLGAAGAVLAGGAAPLTLTSLALLVCMAVLAATPMSYRGRAIGLFLVGASATSVALWQQTVHGIAAEGPILAAATILLSGSLLFRAYYRGAGLSRAAVALGVAALGAWFILSGGHQSLVALEGHWQSWAPAIIHMSFGLLALLSLMAFMDSSTRGGTHVWAGALLFLYAAHVGLLIGTARWPASPGAAMIRGDTIAALLVGAVGTIVAGIALAQVFVSVSQKTSARRSA